MSGPADDRAAAARALFAVIEQSRTTDQAFESKPKSPLTRELVYGVLRHYHALSERVDAQLGKPLKRKDRDLRCLLLVGAYQLQFLRIPSHAAINETVNGCRALGKPWASGLINAVLRALAREGPQDETDRSVEFPEWIRVRLLTAFPDNAPDLFAGLLERAPMSLRVNTARTNPADYAARLDAEDRKWHPGYYPEHVLLEVPVPSRLLPGYAEGLVSIQDSGALVAAHILGAGNPRRLLDACAAPGGKLFHMAEHMPDATLVGLEQNPNRLRHLATEAQRLGHEGVTLLQGDATAQDWWDGRPFDAVLLDAPCSGSGTLRRHPEIKLLRRAGDLAGYRALQLALLLNLWQTLSPDGTLLYCTCSLFQEENDNVVREFLVGTDDATSVPVQAPSGRPTELGWQLLPTAGARISPDGFYYALLRKALP